MIEQRRNECSVMMGYPGRLSASRAAQIRTRNWCRRGIVAALALFLLLGAGAAFAKEKDKLPARYREWLDKDVAYIISKEEREAFRRLASDEDRDKFIEQFWEIRNPTPRAATNPYKEEHYRRLDYADKNFGIGSGTDGWRTDRGRIYIQLGEPAQRMKWISHGRVRPAELWFYSNNLSPSLPGSFYVLFYQRDEVGDYRLYSPYLDGPTKLVRGADTNAQAYQLLRQLSPELARASLSLLSDEPIDRDNFTTSLSSDAMLVRIHNLPNDRFTKEKLGRGRQLREVVQSRLQLETKSLDVLAVSFQAPSGEIYVHFLLDIPKSLEELSGLDKDKNQHYISAEVNVMVRTAEGGQLFQQSHSQLFTFSPAQFEDQRQLLVSYEDRLPLPPGSYDLAFVFLDVVHHEYYLARRTVTVPGTPTSLKVGPLVAYDEAVQVEPGQADSPFDFFNIRFFPSARREFSVGERLSLFFQLHSPPTGSSGSPAGKLQVEYTLGSLVDGGARQTVTQEIETRQFDAHGALLHGKQLPLGDFPPGNYRLVVKVTDPQTNLFDAQTLSFRVLALSPRTRRVTLINDQFRQDRQTGLLDYRRGICLAAQGQLQQAIESFQAALAQDSRFDSARNHLADLYFRQERYSDIVKLFEHFAVTSRTDLGTVGILLTSLEKLGHLDQAIATGEKALALLGPSQGLYEQLASLYERAGQPGRARQAREEAERLTQAAKQGKGENK